MKFTTLYKRSFIVGFASSLYAFIVWLGYWSALLLISCALGAIAAAYVCRRMAKERIRWEVSSTLAEQQMQKLKEGPGTLLESFTMGWFNLVLQALWSPILEKHIAGLTGDLLQKVLNEVREKNSAKAPWKYLEAISLEELRFGAVPPRFQNALAKYDPTASMLTFVMDVTFTSNSAQAVMLVRTKVLPVVATALNVRLEATYVQFSGRLHLGLLLGSEPPGIKGIYYSFATKPTLDIAVRPLGMALPPELIALTGALQGVLQKIISRRMVEPQRRFFDLHRMYMNRHIARVGGPGGLLRVVIHTAKNLVPSNRQDPSSSTNSSSFLELAAAAAKASNYEQIAAKFQTATLGNNKKPGSMATFCELKYNSQIMRTPVAHHTAAAAAVWEWQLSLALPADLAAAAAAGTGVQGNSSTAAAARSAGSTVAGAAAGKGAAAAAAGCGGVCLLAVYEAQSLGDPVLLGKCKIHLSTLGLKPNSDSQDVTLPLQGPNWPNATVTLSLTWLKSTRPVQQRQKWQPQSETVYKPQQQQQQQQRTATQGDASVVSLQTQQQHQQQHGHSRNQSNQSVRSLGEISVLGGDSGATSATASNAAAGAAAAGHKSVSWTDEDQAAVPAKLEIPQSPLGPWEGPTSLQQQQQQQQTISVADLNPRISKSAGSSPLRDQQQQPQMLYQRTDSSHRRSRTVDLGAVAAAAAAGSSGSRSVGATPRGSSVTGSTTAPAAAAAPRLAGSPVTGDRTWRATRSQGSALLAAAAAAAPLADLTAAAAATPKSGSRPSTSTEQQQQQHSTTDPEDEDSFQNSFAEYIPKRRPWLSSTSLSGWGSWIGLSTAAGSSSSTRLDAAAAAAVRSGSAGSAPDLGLNDAAANPAAAAAVEQATAASSRDNRSTPAVAAAAATFSDFSSPLTMLASVVQLHKQVELQQQQVCALQQQLMAVSSRHIKQQQQCRHNARSALMKGARFVMHNADGSQQPVLLYLTQQHPSLIAAAAAAAGQKDKSSRSLFGSSDKASRESSFASSNAQQQQQQRRTPSVVSSKSGRSTPENAQQLELQPQQQQQQHLRGSSNEWYLVIAALPADGEGFRAAAKRRIAAVLARPGSPAPAAAAAAANSSGAAGKGSPSSSGGGQAPVTAGTAGFSRRERRLLSHAGAYESGDLARHDLPVITIIPVSQLTYVQLVPSSECHSAAADSEESHKSSSANLVHKNGDNTSADPDLDVDLDLDCPILILSVRSQRLDSGARKGVVENQQTVHLQVPAVGNGRSGDEWLMALEQLRDTPPGNSAIAQVEHV